MSIRHIALVPMVVDAYLNVDPNLTVPTNPNDRAYLAPITTPNLTGLRLDNSLIQQDIFDDIRNAPYECSADRYRKTPSRQGIYIHWSLPRAYRVGVTGSDSAQDDLPLKLRQGGYPDYTLQQSLMDRLPLFRTVPARWIVARTIRPTLLGPIMVANATSGRVSYGASVVRNMFVVESDCIRNIKDIPATEDVEVTASPYIDPSLPANQQGQTYLGRCSLWEKWPGDHYPINNLTKITVNQIANPYFADYQPQNAGVFSFFDDLTLPQGGTFGSDYKFVSGSISYTVMGYHDFEFNDPLYLDVSINQTPAEKLAACQMEVSSTGLTADDQTWLQTPLTPNNQFQNMRALCHGSFYNVLWNFPPAGSPVPSTFKFPADDLQQSFAKSQPLSVGTNPIDALFAWLRSTNSSNGLPTDDMRRYLTKIQTLVLDLNDDIDSQLQAEDLLATNNFIPSPQGVYWHFKDTDPDNKSNTLTPTPDQATALKSMNDNQRVVNALQRQQARLRAELFSTWFTYVADRNTGTPADQHSRVGLLSQKVTSLRTQLDANDDGKGGGAINTYQAAVKSAQGLLPGNTGVVAGTEPNFYMQRDPTLFIAGLSSKWPTNFNDKLQIRLQDQASSYVNGSGKTQPMPNVPTASLLAAKIPDMFVSSMTNLLGEAEIEYLGIPNEHATVAPEYFNAGDRFTGQNGWFPLFIEWEAEYYHIPFDLWSFAPQGPQARIGYGLQASADPANVNIQSDYRVLSGRCPVLPQASAMLEATLKQVFARASPDVLSQSLTPEEREQLLATARSLDFSSTPLSGFTDQLVTRMQGTHTTPSYSDDSGPWGTLKLNIRDDAKTFGAEIGMTPDDFALIGDQNTFTPFASLVDIPSDTGQHNPFKPCMHGQFRFTKLNIIDKFGQVVRGLGTMSDPAHSIGPTITPLLPCLGASYSVEETAQGWPKIVLPRSDQLCPFVQLPPSINQNARVNANFVVQDGTSWRAVDEWENPVRGWLVVNFANVSIQIFTPGGDFVREFSAVNGVPIVRPFAGDDSLMNTLDPVLASLVKQFMYSGYLAGLFCTLLVTMQAVQANPTSYAESMLSVLGRPLALTTFGVSIELADPPMQSQSTVSTSQPIEDLLSYKFGMKIGDKDNVFDGLYGYFNVDSAGSADYSSFYSYHPPDALDKPLANDPCKPIPTDLTIPPFYADPTAGPAGYAQQQHQALRIFAGLVDPFTPTHVYSAVLPINQLTLPPWTIAAGVSRIAAFFKLGPVLVPADVPPFDPAKVVARDYRLDDKTAPASTGTIAMPSVAVADWAWLQPYLTAGPGPTGDETGTQYNALDVSAVGQKPNWGQGAPYTAVDGFLQMKTPFTAPDASGSEL